MLYLEVHYNVQKILLDFFLNLYNPVWSFTHHCSNISSGIIYLVKLFIRIYYCFIVKWFKRSLLAFNHLMISGLQGEFSLDIFSTRKCTVHHLAYVSHIWVYLQLSWISSCGRPERRVFQLGGWALSRHPLNIRNFHVKICLRGP
jgi:hypothetical protein